MTSFLKSFFSPKTSKFQKKYIGKIEIFSRHCIFSEISKNKVRFPEFSREACYQNLLRTTSFERANLTFFLDVKGGSKETHYLKEEKTFPVVEIEEGSEAGSFLRLLDYVSELELPPETILYFVEDDYLHQDGWVEVLLEAFEIEGVEYATLYDHRDKYFFPEYKDLLSKIYLTKSCHWRTTPSTTQTFAVRYATLKRDLSIHRKYSQDRKISSDHEKFCHLRRRGEILVSSIPGFSTHAEPDYASPHVDWEAFFINTDLWSTYGYYQNTDLGK